MCASRFIILLGDCRTCETRSRTAMSAEPEARAKVLGERGGVRDVPRSTQSSCRVHEQLTTIDKGESVPLERKGLTGCSSKRRARGDYPPLHGSTPRGWSTPRGPRPRPTVVTILYGITHYGWCSVFRPGFPARRRIGPCQVPTPMDPGWESIPSHIRIGARARFSGRGGSFSGHSPPSLESALVPSSRRLDALFPAPR